MSSIDILQDVHDRKRVNKIRLFLVHIVAIVCMVYLGISLMTTITIATFKSIDEQIQDIKNGNGLAPSSLEDINLRLIYIQISAYVFAIIGGIISFVICRRLKLAVVIPISIVLYGIIVYWISSQIPYVGLLIPGTYLLKYFGWNIGPIVNTVYFGIIIWFLFFSKRVKNWWLKPVVE